MSGGEGPKTYLVECYWPGVNEAVLAAAEARARKASADLGAEGREIAFLGSVLVPADETVFCFFAGCEADIRSASELAQIPFERILEAGPVEIPARVDETS